MSADDLDSRDDAPTGSLRPEGSAIAVVWLPRAVPAPSPGDRAVGVLLTDLARLERRDVSAVLRDVCQGRGPAVTGPGEEEHG